MKMRHFNATVLSALLLSASAAAEATTYQGTITNITAADGKIYIYVGNGAFAGAAGTCNNGSGMVYAIPTTPSASDFSKSMIAIALTAKTTGLLVYASGDGNCASGNAYNGGGYEALAYLDLKG